MKLCSKFSSSAQELTKLRSLLGLSMFIAIGVILRVFLTIQLSQSQRIGTSFLAFALIGMLYGPAAGLIGGAIIDVLAFFLKPTGGFFIGFTICAALSVVIYGVFFDRENPRFWRVLVAQLLVSVLLNWLLTSYWLPFFSGSKTWVAYLYQRGSWELIMLPVQMIVIAAALKAGQMAVGRHKRL